VQQAQLANMERDAERLYELIWRQFVACQMPAAEYLDDDHRRGGRLRARRPRPHRALRRLHARAAAAGTRKGEDTVLPDLAEGDALKLLALHPAQHFTKPPPRYGEAKLVKELEKRGIGRPSTYASIISTIQDRGYVRLENRRFYAEKMGEIVTDRLQGSFSDLLDYGFTAGMEEHLDEVAGGRARLAQALSTTSTPTSRRASRRRGFPSPTACRPTRRR
jgi:DNA topoisomerase-1